MANSPVSKDSYYWISKAIGLGLRSRMNGNIPTQIQAERQQGIMQI